MTEKYKSPKLEFAYRQRDNRVKQRKEEEKKEKNTLGQAKLRSGMRRFNRGGKV